MKKILYTDFEDIESIISQMLDKSEIKKALVRSNLCKFWEKAVGAKLAKYSKPYSMIQSGTMVIACKTPAAAQELTLIKAKILKNFEPYLKSLHFKVVDLKFDCRKWKDD